MKCYGKTFRYLERFDQESIEKSSNYKQCPSCKVMRHVREFKGEHRTYKSCSKCRKHANAYNQRKRNEG